MEPTPLPANLRIVMIVAAAVLALVGGVGIATGAADDNNDDLTTAGGTTTPTLGVTGTTLGLGENSPTTVAGSTTPTAKPGATGTTAKPATTGTTVAPAATDACGAPPESLTNPGAISPPAIGIYSFVSCEGGDAVDDETIRTGDSSDGKPRRLVSHNQQGVQLTETVAYSADGVIQEVLDVSAFGQQARCDWKPDIVEYPANLAVGSQWSVKSSCTTSFGQFKVDGTGKVTGRRTVTIAGTAVNTWVIETKVKIETPQGNQEADELDYFDPSRGIDLYRKTVASDGQGGKVTLVRRLASLTPRSL